MVYIFIFATHSLPFSSTSANPLNTRLCEGLRSHIRLLIGLQCQVELGKKHSPTELAPYPTLPYRDFTLHLFDTFSLHKICKAPTPREKRLVPPTHETLKKSSIFFSLHVKCKVIKKLFRRQLFVS